MAHDAELERGREAYRRRAWEEARRALSDAEERSPLPPGDLERLATASYLTGREDAFRAVLDRAHRAHLDAGDTERAARCAFWSGLTLLLRGETGPATGWLGRARRLVEGRDCVEHGYLLLPVAERDVVEGDHEAGYEAASEAAAIGDRFGDADLVACARHLQGRALMETGRMGEGLALLDEVMVEATAGDLSPIVTGLIYCSVIDACQRACVLGRAREWTSTLARWCEDQPQLVAFTATCLVHRAEILQWTGAWPDAIEEARRACERREPPAEAFYQRAEVHRLRGEFDAAEEAYRDASRKGYDPQPGLSLLRLAQGRVDAAVAAIRRALGAVEDRTARVRLLPACVETLLAAGEVERAEEACRELETIATSLDTGMVAAMAAHARGAVDLARDEPEAALGSLRRAGRAWRSVEVPYQAARAREMVGRACRALGDEEGERLELEAARAAFEALGAAPDLARVDRLLGGERADLPEGLTAREIEVLRLVATGRTNRSVAEELCLSPKTIERHLSNIFRKIGVSSRAAATAWAYENDVV